MKKLLVSLLVIVVVLVLVVFVGGQFFVGSAVKAGVNTFGPRVTQTNVHLDGASISPFSGNGTLTNLVVGNPQGWSDRNAFSLGRVAIDLEPRTVLGDQPVVINSIIIDQPEIAYETKIVSSNIGDLMKNIEASVGGGEKPATKDEKPPRKLIVKKFVLRDAKVSLGVGSTAMTVPMPAVELTDIGVKENGVTPAQLAFAVMRSVTAQVVAATTAALGKSGSTMGAAGADALKRAGDGLKDLLGGKK